MIICKITSRFAPPLPQPAPSFSSFFSSASSSESLVAPRSNESNEEAQGPGLVVMVIW